MFQISKKIPKSLGRAGVLTTSHGEILTPAFVVVGTKATVKSLTPEQVASAGSQVVLANTYHLYLEPGEKIIKKAEGLHKFMNWSGPIMTDSGGFQAFSLGVAYGNKLSKFIGAKSPKPEEIDEAYDEEKEKKARPLTPKRSDGGRENIFKPVEDGCGCYTCKNYTSAYVSHLFRSKEMLAATLASIHNLYFLNNLMSQIRESILAGTFFEFKKMFLETYK